MRFGFAVPSYGDQADGAAIRDLLVAGDELGFASALFPDHIAVPDYARHANLDPPFLEPLATCAWGLACTKRIRLGTDVLVGPYRHPLLVAAMAGTIGRLAGDRLVLGVGIGYLRGEFDVLGAGPYAARAEATEAFLRTVRSPPDGYSLMTAPRPTPLWVGGNGVPAQRRAARLGDGWHPLWMSDAAYAHARRRILEARSSAGLTGPFTFSYSCGSTRLLMRSPASWPALPPRPTRGSEFRYTPEWWLDDDGRPRFMGRPDQLVEDFRLLAAAGVEHVTLRFGATEVRDLERFAAEVAPAFDG